MKKEFLGSTLNKHFAWHLLVSGICKIKKNLHSGKVQLVGLGGGKLKPTA